MTDTSLIVAVRFHDGRYYGQDDGLDGAEGWPPSPGRLFQAFVAGAARGAHLLREDMLALTWLERLDPPRIAAPPARRGRAIKLFVPNNDLDSVGGDPQRVGEIRVGKHWRPCFFDHTEPVLYAWDFKSDVAEAERICAIARRLYQLGRGIDMASASGRTATRDEADALMETHPGTLRMPNGSGGIATPTDGTLASLVERYRQKRSRLTTEGSGRKSRQLFRQPAKASFRHVGYDAPPRCLYFDLRTTSGAFAPRPLPSVLPLLTGLRDGAARRLSDSLPDESTVFERMIIGKDAGPHDLSQRIRIVPIPSIGAEHTDPSIRRILIEVPADCSIRVDDLKWAFAGLQPTDPETGHIWPGVLVSTDESQMAGRYMRSARLHRTITPAVLPGGRRRRVGIGETKSGSQRDEEEARARSAVMQALRHADIRTRPSQIRVQREPFQPKGARAELFHVGSRFSKHALWHVELRFPEPVAGPVLIGDGRFCGLGLMEPVVTRPDVIAYELKRSVRSENGPMLVGHLRRALMSLARDEGGRVARLFSGHEYDGRSDGGGHHAHVFLAADSGVDGVGHIDRLLVVAPWAADRRAERTPADRRRFDEVTRQLVDLRAGRVGHFDDLCAKPVADGDALVGPGLVWACRIPYIATRNLKRHDDPTEAIRSDVAVECSRRGLPAPRAIDVSELHVGPRGGRPTAMLRLRFAVSVRGPVLLGRNSHAGGGLFHAVHR